MANTLNLGTDGNWATKEDSLLAYNSENGNFKPLPFDFTRASSATVVNKAGLIETVGSGEPRIDFSNDAKGALLLEPQRSNLIPNSQDIITGWSTIRVTVQNNQTISPDGVLNAALSTVTSDNGSHASFETLTGVLTSGSNNYISCFVKKSTTRYIRLNEGYVNDTVAFDLDTQTFVITQGSPTDVIFEDYGNGWYRIGFKFVAHSSGSTQFVLYINDNNNNISYAGNGESVYLWGAQVEQGIYATSYIPNFGNSAGATRSADVCNNGGNEQVINSTEGVLYAEISASSYNLTYNVWSLNNGVNKEVFIGKINGFLSSSLYDGTNFLLNNSIALLSGNNKVALKWVSGISAEIWLNGVKVVTYNGTIPAFNSNDLKNLSQGDRAGANPFYGNTKDVRVYNTALTDAELIALTK